MTTDERGQIITFYSYKGGTGRSMALANIACLLAEQQTATHGKGVLMIDWDLEAPGLHRYFADRLATPKLRVEALNALNRRDIHNAAPGLIDLFYELDKQVSQPTTDGNTTNEQAAREAIGRVKLSDFILSTTINGLSLLKAGRFTTPDPNEYSERVNKFNWESLFKKSPHLMRVFAETLAKQYAYVLIDSRTGITDISGITTMLLPEKLVIVFTPNLQSLKGGLELVRKATDYRKESVDLRPLTVFPLVSRVEANQPELRQEWRFGNKYTEGFQHEFEKILTEVYGDRITLNKYFDELQIQHIPRYAYGEEVAVLVEKTSDKFSLRRSYQSFAMKLVKSQAPWEGEIEEGAKVDRSESIMARVVNSMVRNKTALLILIFAAILFSLLTLALYGFQRARALQQVAEIERHRLSDENEELKKQVADLQDPIKGILADNNKRIEELTQQVADVSKQRDDAVQQLQAEQALANRAVNAQKQAEATLATVQADANDANQAYQRALAQYTASQKEVRSLQARVANCRPPAAAP